MSGPLLVVQGKNNSTTLQLSLPVLRELFKDSITGWVTCPTCGTSGHVLYDHGEEGRKISIHIVDVTCPNCKTRWETEAEVGAGFERLTKQKLDALLRNSKTLLAAVA